MIVIGSRALNHHMPLRGRITPTTDFDLVMSVEEFMKWQTENKLFIQLLIPRSANKYKAKVKPAFGNKLVQYEIELGFEGTSSKWLLDNVSIACKGQMKGLLEEELSILTPRYLMATKRSHLIYPIHFEKNMKDYQLLKERLNDWNDSSKIQEYYQLRFNEAKERNKQRTPKLNVTTEDFFSSKLAATSYFVHDHIHERMAHDNVPMYTKMQPDPSMAWCSKDMFFNLTYKEQVQCVQEEAYVIALERYIIPQHGDYCKDFFECYKRALLRICTTLCSGWFRDFAIDNYQVAIWWYNPEFVKNFVKDIEEGRIIPKPEWTVEQVPLMKFFREAK
jgi:hypothetical protein